MFLNVYEGGKYPSIDALIKKINKAATTKLKVSGRSYKTGRKKTANITIKNILCNCLD